MFHSSVKSTASIRTMFRVLRVFVVSSTVRLRLRRINVLVEIVVAEFKFQYVLYNQTGSFKFLIDLFNLTLVVFRREIT
jgi:hypothetical protein